MKRGKPRRLIVSSPKLGRSSMYWIAVDNSVERSFRRRQVFDAAIISLNAGP
jgi:hypothetical protein